MKVYNYLLFRIYRFYTDKIKEKDIPLIYTSTVSTVLVYFNLYAIYSFLVYKDFVKELMPNKYYVLITMGIIWILNYLFFVKRARFLECDFTKDIGGGVLIIIYFLFTITTSIVVANYSRAKIEIQRHSHPTANPIKQKPSLEGKVKKWFNNTF